MSGDRADNTAGQKSGWRKSAGKGAAMRHLGDENERREKPPVMSRSRAQLATTYAPGVLFTWEGAKGICRSVPVAPTEARVSDATKLLVQGGIAEFAKSWKDRATSARAPAPVPIELALDTLFYDPRTYKVEREWRDFIQFCDPGVMGYVPYPLAYSCATCGKVREYQSIEEQARHPLPARCGDHAARWTQIDVVYVHWSGSLEPLSPFRNNYDQSKRQTIKLRSCTCGSQEFSLKKAGHRFNEWSFVCDGCKTPRDLKQPDAFTLDILEREQRNGGRTFEFAEVNMLPVSYRANSAFYPQKGTFIEFEDRSVVEVLYPEREEDLLQRLAQIHGFPYQAPSDDEIRAALSAASRATEWDEYIDNLDLAERAEGRGQAELAQRRRRDAADVRNKWFDDGIISRGKVESAALLSNVVDRRLVGWANRYDPVRLTIEHDRFVAEHIEQRRSRREAIDVSDPDKLLSDAVGDPVALDEYKGTLSRLLGALGLEQIVLIRGLPICEFSFGYTRVSSSPVYFRELNGRQIPMPVRLNAFPSLPNGKAPVYITQQRNEALYFKLDEQRVRRWLEDNGVSDLPPEGTTLGAAYLETYSDFGSYLDEFKGREGKAGTFRSLSSYIYLLLHTFSHQVMHAMADISGLDRDGLGEYIFPADLAFVVYRKGMTPDLGNISAMWRNHAFDFLRHLIDPRMLRCGSGSLCDTRGGACPACVMVSEVTCIGGNQLLSRASLKGGPAPTWEARDSSPLVGYFDPRLAP
mgnify:CR=1 FL=1|jgi:hypothetical protein